MAFNFDDFAKKKQEGAMALDAQGNTSRESMNAATNATNVQTTGMNNAANIKTTEMNNNAQLQNTGLQNQGNLAAGAQRIAGSSALSKQDYGQSLGLNAQEAGFRRNDAASAKDPNTQLSPGLSFDPSKYSPFKYKKGGFVPGKQILGEGDNRNAKIQTGEYILPRETTKQLGKGNLDNLVKKTTGQIPLGGKKGRGFYSGGMFGKALEESEQIGNKLKDNPEETRKTVQASLEKTLPLGGIAKAKEVFVPIKNVVNAGNGALRQTVTQIPTTVTQTYNKGRNILTGVLGKLGGNNTTTNDRLPIHENSTWKSKDSSDVKISEENNPYETNGKAKQSYLDAREKFVNDVKEENRKKTEEDKDEEMKYKEGDSPETIEKKTQYNAGRTYQERERRAASKDANEDKISNINQQLGNLGIKNYTSKKDLADIAQAGHLATAQTRIYEVPSNQMTIEEKNSAAQNMRNANNPSKEWKEGTPAKKGKKHTFLPNEPDTEATPGYWADKDEEQILAEANRRRAKAK